MPKITFIGAGSTVFAKNILGDCMLTPSLSESEIALYDIDAVRLKESSDMLEAAAIDGANGRTTLFRIIIPSVMPSITICLFLTLTNGFKLYDQNLALTNGAPNHQTEMLALNIFNTFYSRTGFEGVGQAKAVIFTILVAAIALLQLIFTRKKEVEN